MVFFDHNLKIIHELYLSKYKENYIVVDKNRVEFSKIVIHLDEIRKIESQEVVHINEKGTSRIKEQTENKS